jgi:hypothetical protein
VYTSIISDRHIIIFNTAQYNINMDSTNTDNKKKKEKGRYPQLPTQKHREDGTSNVDVAKKDDGEEAKGLSLDQSIKNNKRKMDGIEDGVPSKKFKDISSIPSPSASAADSTSRSSYIGVTYQSNLLKYEAKLSGEYNLGLFDLACDAAYMHDVAYRITGGGSSSRSKNLLIANDSDKIDYHCNWLEKERDAKDEAVATADDNKVNFSTPSQYSKARALEMSGRMNDKVLDESELKIIIRKEILNLAVAYLSTTQKQREGGVEERDNKKKVKSSLHKKKSWTPDIEEDNQNASVHPTLQQDDELEALRRKEHNETKKMALANKLKRMMSGEYGHQDTSQCAVRHSYVPHQIGKNIPEEELNNESLHQLLLYQLAARQQQQRFGSIGFPSSNGINPSSLEQLLLLASARSNGIVNENIVRQMEQQQALKESRPRPWGRQHDTHINHLENRVDDPDIAMYRNLINEAKRASLAQKLSAFQGNGNDGGLDATSAQARTKEDRAEDQATSECSALLLELARGGTSKEGNNNEQDSSEQQGCDSTTTKSSSLKSSEDDDDLDDNKVLKEGNGEALETTTPSLQQQLLLAARVQELQGVQRHAQTPQNVSTMLIQRLMQREMEERSNQALGEYHSDLVRQAHSIIRNRQMETQSTTGGNNSFSAPDIHRHILNESLSRGQINQGRQINEAGIQQAINRYEQIARLPYEQVAHFVNLAKSASEQERK